MNEEQLDTVAEFVDKLLELGPLAVMPEGENMLRNGPLKIVPKPGQSGQWRVLSDMQKGGQNDHIADDLIHYPQIPDILPD
eukprot:4324380-Ditylum_brightwellii.AAC.1